MLALRLKKHSNFFINYCFLFVTFVIVCTFKIIQQFIRMSLVSNYISRIYSIITSTIYLSIHLTLNHFFIYIHEYERLLTIQWSMLYFPVYSSTFFISGCLSPPLIRGFIPGVVVSLAALGSFL